MTGTMMMERTGMGMGMPNMGTTPMPGSSMALA